MRVLITGAAGFVGSHLATACIERGDEVVGIDALTPFYDPIEKRTNLARLSGAAASTIIIDDVCELELRAVLDGVDVVYHLAGQPGVRPMASVSDADYWHNNVESTRALLAAAVEVRTPRFVLASSSSVYGEVGHQRMLVGDAPRPHSVYGRSKLAAEASCLESAQESGLSVVCLRQFSVYGPRQRPDMAIRRFISAALSGLAAPVLGSGDQARDFTYVADCVAAFLAAGARDLAPGAIFNVAAGRTISLHEVIRQIARSIGHDVAEARLPSSAEDVSTTWADIGPTCEALGWEPRVSLLAGVELQLAWQLRELDQPSGAQA